MEIERNASSDVRLIFIRNTKRSRHLAETHLEIPPLTIAVKAPGNRPEYSVGVIFLRRDKR
jgi:hypothetical protein